jgi:hypothetical protein
MGKKAYLNRADVIAISVIEAYNISLYLIRVHFIVENKTTWAVVGSWGNNTNILGE